MATQLIYIQNTDHLTYVMQQFPAMLVFFDNDQDTACQKLKAPLFEKCRAQNMPIAIVQISANPLKQSFPFVNVVKNGEAVVSLYDADIKTLWTHVHRYLALGVTSKT